MSDPTVDPAEPPHPLLAIVESAAVGEFPAVDGGVTLVRPLRGGIEAIVCFTGHAVIATRFSHDEIDDLSPDGFGAATHPAIQMRMANGGTIGVTDVTLVASGLGGAPLVEPTHEWDDHPRVAYARGQRTDVVVYGDSSGFVTLGSGLAGRTEMSIEVAEDFHDTGHGRRLIHAARGLVAPDQHLFAGVSPGNARSLRSFLSQGFVPIGSEVIIIPNP